MAGRNHFRLTLKMLYEEQDEENEEAILSLDSKSEVSDAPTPAWSYYTYTPHQFKLPAL